MKNVFFFMLMFSVNAFALEVFDCRVQYPVGGHGTYVGRITLESTEVDFFKPDQVPFDVLSGRVARDVGGHSEFSNLGPGLPERAFGPMWMTVENLKRTWFVNNLPAGIDDQTPAIAFQLFLNGSFDPQLAFSIVGQGNKPSVSLVMFNNQAYYCQ